MPSGRHHTRWRRARRLLKKAHLLRWHPWPHAQRTGSTPRVRPAGAASHLDLFDGGPRDGPPYPPTLGAPRQSRGAPRPRTVLRSLRVFRDPATSISEHRGAPRLCRGGPNVGGLGALSRPPCSEDERAGWDEVADDAEREVEEILAAREDVRRDVRDPAVSDDELERAGEPLLVGKD